jgi:TonB-linked SusC/RagA family outer membrane protein
LAVSLAAVALPVEASSQTAGVITGRVTDAASGQPIVGAQVIVVGSQRGAQANEDGTYRLPNVPPGTLRIQALRIGYAAQTRTVTVGEGATVTADFALSVTATQLDVVTTTATGQSQRQRESGAKTEVIDVDSKINKAAVTNLSEVLSSRAPGVTVQTSGGTTGAGSRVRIRGSNSVSLGNSPLIILDGIRVNNDPTSTSIGVGGQQPSRFDDINPEDIESIEVIKGPAAAALYGTAAANGVIQITTKRGRPGRTMWNAYVEGGSLDEYTDWPTNFAQIGTRTALTGCVPTAANQFCRTTACTLDQQTRGLCTPRGDSLMTHNPIEVAGPFRTGWRTSYGLNVAGGGEAATYYIGTDLEREQGVYEANTLRRINLRANVRGQLRRNLDASVSTGYISNDLRLPQNDNNLLGAISSGLLGLAFDCRPVTPCGADTISRGYVSGQPPQQIYAIRTMQEIERYTGSINSNWTPTSWLQVTGTSGLDVLNRYDHELVPPNRVLIGSLPEGQRTSNRFQIFSYTTNVNGIATFDVTPELLSTTTVGIQYVDEILHSTEAFGARILAGTESLEGASARFAVDEDNEEVVTIGGLVNEQLAWRDRLYLTAGIRGDDNSSFGQDFEFVTYPAVSLSWVVGEEAFFPKSDMLSSLRLRSSWGRSGQRPGFRQATTFFTPVSVAVNNTDVPAVTVGGSGNAKLKPERSTEYELGFDAGFLNDRLALELTYYDKVTRDALVAVPLAPSLGAANSVFKNLGRVSNKGWEALFNASILSTPRVKWDATITGSTNENELIELGEGVVPIIFGLGGSSQRHQEGYPLGGFWTRSLISWQDKNGDGIISRVGCGATQALNTAACEVIISDTAEYQGTPFPRREVTFSQTITLFDVVRLTSLFDYRGGFKQYHATEFFRCASAFVNCRAAFDKNAPLRDQAETIAALMGSNDAYMEDASFVKLREVAVTLMAPADWARRFGVSDLSLTLAGRNLKTWTDYRGFDPELNVSSQLNFNQADFLTQPPVRTFTTRLNIIF